MNKEILKQAGFDQAAANIEQTLCPICSKKIIPKKEFRDIVSVKEFKISGLCQNCQDKVF